jgi:hypothetical protein
MKLWLTRQHNGLYMLTRLKPQESTILGTDKKGMYIEKGEPVGMLNLCDLALKVFQLEKELDPGQSVRVELKGNLL